MFPAEGVTIILAISQAWFFSALSCHTVQYGQPGGSTDMGPAQHTR